MTIFLVPYLCILLYFAGIYAYDSWAISEISASLVGLSHRWIIKSFLVAGVLVAIVAGISVWLQVAIALFGPKHHRFELMTIEWPEETGSMIEGKERLDLDKVDDLVEVRRKEREQKEREKEAT